MLHTLYIQQQWNNDNVSLLRHLGFGMPAEKTILAPYTTLRSTGSTERRFNAYIIACVRFKPLNIQAVGLFVYFFQSFELLVSLTFD